jgi:hypothetical protein
MAMTIFTIVNGLGVVFLLYVLAKFWQEGRHPGSNALNYDRRIEQRDWAQVLVITHPISHTAQGGVSVIPFQTRGLKPGGKREDHEVGSETSGTRAGMVSAR